MFVLWCRSRTEDDDEEEEEDAEEEEEEEPATEAEEETSGVVVDKEEEEEKEEEIEVGRWRRPDPGDFLILSGLNVPLTLNTTAPFDDRDRMPRRRGAP